MSTYCMSDIHGQIDAFNEMLEKIEFSSDDKLYVIGDVVDRGPAGVDMLLKVKSMPNATMLLGNHEHMMMEFFSPDATEKQIKRWNKNRNTPTITKFLALSDEKKEEVLEFIRNMPTHVELNVSGRDFYLVHGWPGENTHDEVWGRPSSPEEKNPLKDKMLIIGHTPVSYLINGDDDKEEAYLTALEEKGEHVKILKTGEFTDIDCSCGYPYRSCALGCLRLDDMQEFYIPVKTEY